MEAKTRPRYQIITATNPVELSRLVEGMLEKGWELHGAPFISGDLTLMSQDWIIAQAVTKRP